MQNKFIELHTQTIRYVLPWHAPTIIHAIKSNNINVEKLQFDSNQQKQKLTHDLFLIAASDCMSKSSNEPSPLALMARALLH